MPRSGIGKNQPVFNCYNMLKKHAVLLGISISVFLLLWAMQVYPGGSLSDKDSVGFVWSKNFISNLFAAKAVNGSDNPSRLWADAGMIFLSASFALFFIGFSKRIPHTRAAKVIKYLGSGGMLFTFLIVTPLHDLMVTISATLFLLSMFYITVFILKSRLHLFKVLCILYLLFFYYTLYIYGSGDYSFLPIAQKIVFVSTIVLVLGLEYFTRKEDFEHLGTARRNGE